ncbi:MAG TPA: DUF308 domain-containing protein [Gaiellaceae bacterium]|nr:DUF308 domain-containing protein [Gaiellaceae bacterium]
MTTAPYDPMATARMLSKAWWVFLVTGVLWLVMSLIVFRMELGTVYAISILFGILAIAAGVDEFLSVGAVHGGWRWLHGILGVIFVVAGIVAFANPDWTFLALASIIGWWFLFKGTLDVIAAFAMKRANELWWIQLVVGLIELGLAFWVAGNFYEQVILLVVYVGVMCLSKGLTDVLLAFRLRGLR